MSQQPLLLLMTGGLFTAHQHTCQVRPTRSHWAAIDAESTSLHAVAGATAVDRPVGIDRKAIGSV